MKGLFGPQRGQDPQVENALSNILMLGTHGSRHGKGAGVPLSLCFVPPSSSSSELKKPDGKRAHWGRGGAHTKDLDSRNQTMGTAVQMLL